MSLLDGIKNKLRIPKEDTSQDDLIKEETDDLTLEVLEICQLKELPKALEPFVKRKVVAYIRGGMTGIAGEWDEQVKSISKGDTTISMMSTKERLTTDDLQLIEKFRPKRVIAK